MKRKDFIRLLGISPLIAQTMKVNALNSFLDAPNTEKMPVLFLGHGSPINGIEDNEFVRGFQKIGQEINKPKAILCISAHWETKGTYVTAMEQPRTIHDFGGFPPALYEVQYPAPGSPQLANETKKIIQSTDVHLDHKWGLDHGAWTVIKQMYPDADVPVIQLSLDYTQPASYHFALARELSTLRHKGVLIVGSGNMVHNLGKVAWNKLAEPFAFDWAKEAHDTMNASVMKEDFQSLIDYNKQGSAFQLAVPTPEHYLPLLYALALKDQKDETHVFNDEPVAGSLYMTSYKFSE